MSRTAGDDPKAVRKMTEEVEIPFKNLPPGFAEQVPEEGRPAPGSVRPAQPAATLVLLRAGGGTPAGEPATDVGAGMGPAEAGTGSEPGVHLEEDGPHLEVLLLRRSPGVSFVPGAWVFPGGGLEAADQGPGSREILGRLDLDRLAGSLAIPPDAPPPHAHLVAAYRETLEETGILPASRILPAAEELPAIQTPPATAVLPEARSVSAARGSGSGGLEADARQTGGAVTPARSRELRRRLLMGEASFPELLLEAGIRLDGAEPAYLAHWVSPELEGRRYDTRFFAVPHRKNEPGSPQAGEGVEVRWISPAQALQLHQAGELPLIFPTLLTLQALAPLSSPHAVVQHFRRRPIPRILPRLHRTPRGVLMVTDPAAHR